ncbi:MAG: alpha/beta hydrolase [Chloroflexota bacterium]
MNTEDLLQAGIASARAGDVEKASQYLIEVVQTNPNSELGWLWLGLCRTEAKQKEYCFHRVLAINPQNREARRRLELLHTERNTLPETKPAVPARDNKTDKFQPPPPPVERHIPAQQKSGKGQNNARAVGSKKRKQTTLPLALLAGGAALAVCLGVFGIYLLTRIIPARNAASLPTSMPPATVTATALPAPAYTPVFEQGQCEFVVPPQANVTCGNIILPEDRYGNVTDTIKIAVAVYHSLSASPQPDPILYLQGGPGDEALSWSSEVYDEVIAPLIAERDFVVIDPRGVGYSRPLLECEAVKRTYLSDIQGKFPADQRVSYYEGALLTCKNELNAMGVNLSTYTSTQMAADAKDVIIALGYQQANLYGISYGSRIAQLLMRNHPQVVRSAILDSVVPIEAQILNTDNSAFEQTLQALFEDCKADPACSAAYPDLEAVYQAVTAQLDSQPIRVETPIDTDMTVVRFVDGAAFRNIILWMLRDPRTIGVIPQFIYRTRDGERFMLNLSVAFPVYAFDSISIGVYISVTCRDQVYVMSMDELDETIRNLCRVWDAQPPLPGENDPLVSDIPTLILAGRYDPVTPVSFASQLASHLTQGKAIVFPDQGHAPSASGISDCPRRLIASFLQNPLAPLDTSCINESHTISFVTPFDSNTPISFEPVVIEQYQVATRIPTGWQAAKFGFYNRYRSFGDMTQIGIQSAAVAEADWVNWLYTNFQGDRGFDQPAIKYGEHSANGLTWSLYRTTSHGNPVEIGFAKSGRETVMVLMLCYQDERDALYNAVFLPVVDATIPAK